ncbi:MAG TPA: hypothetical protein VNR67_00785 [Solirubrobacterales bacterium]|nr:hypothetical protein [Solirubrobacterales bacterium]
MSTEDLAESIIALHRCLGAAGIPHAFGGALAAAVYGAPRDTSDIDVNVFVGTERWSGVCNALGVNPHDDPGRPDQDGSLKIDWEGNKVHLFFSTDPLHEEMEGKAHTVTYADATIPLVSPEHLLTRKRLLGRPKDERDIERILEATAVDLAEVEEWVARLGGEQVRAD